MWVPLDAVLSHVNVHRCNLLARAVMKNNFFIDSSVLTASSEEAATEDEGFQKGAAVNRKLVLACTCAFALAAPVVWSQQGARGQQRQSQRPTAGASQRTGQGTINRTRDQSMDRTRDPLSKQDRDRLRTQATDQQRDQFKTCTGTMDHARTRAKSMANSAKESGFQVEEARRQHTQLQEELRNMQETRNQLHQSLNIDQQAAVQQRIETMNQIHERIQSRLQTMEQELSGPEINGKRVADQARATEREMKAYQNQFKKMGDDLGLKND